MTLTDKLLIRLRNISALEFGLGFTVFFLLAILIPILTNDMYEQELNYKLLQQRQSDLQQLVKDHPDQWWYKSDLNMTNEFLGMYKKT